MTIAKHSTHTFDSETFRALERHAVKRGFFDSEIVKQAADKAQEAEVPLEATGDLLQDLCKLADGLRSKGFDKQADTLERNILIYKSAASNLYDVTGETGEKLLDFAHPDGDVTVVGEGELAKVETPQSLAKKVREVAEKQPSGKAGSKTPAGLVRQAQEFAGLAPAEPAAGAVPTARQNIMDQVRATISRALRIPESVKDLKFAQGAAAAGGYWLRPDVQNLYAELTGVSVGKIKLYFAVAQKLGYKTSEVDFRNWLTSRQGTAAVESEINALGRQLGIDDVGSYTSNAAGTATLGRAFEAKVGPSRHWSGFAPGMWGLEMATQGLGAMTREIPDNSNSIYFEVMAPGRANPRVPQNVSKVNELARKFSGAWNNLYTEVWGGAGSPKIAEADAAARGRMNALDKELQAVPAALGNTKELVVGGNITGKALERINNAEAKFDEVIRSPSAAGADKVMRVLGSPEQKRQYVAWAKKARAVFDQTAGMIGQGNVVMGIDVGDNVPGALTSGIDYWERLLKELPAEDEARRIRAQNYLNELKNLQAELATYVGKKFLTLLRALPRLATKYNENVLNVKTPGELQLALKEIGGRKWPRVLKAQHVDKIIRKGAPPVDPGPGGGRRTGPAMVSPRPKGKGQTGVGRNTPSDEEEQAVREMQNAILKIASDADPDTLEKAKVSKRILQNMGQPVRGRPGKATAADGVWGGRTQDAVVEIKKLAAYLKVRDRIDSSIASFRTVDAKKVIDSANNNLRAIVRIMGKLGIDPGKWRTYGPIKLDSIADNLTLETAQASYTAGNKPIMLRDVSNIVQFYTLARTLNVSDFAGRTRREGPAKKQEEAGKMKSEKAPVPEPAPRVSGIPNPATMSREEMMRARTPAAAPAGGLTPAQRKRQEAVQRGMRPTGEWMTPRGASAEFDIEKLAEEVKAANIIKLEQAFTPKPESADPHSKYYRAPVTDVKQKTQLGDVGGGAEQLGAGAGDITVGEFTRILDWFLIRSREVLRATAFPARVYSGGEEVEQEIDPQKVKVAKFYFDQISLLNEQWQRIRKANADLWESDDAIINPVDLYQAASGQRRGRRSRRGPAYSGGPEGFSAGVEGGLDRAFLERGPLANEILDVPRLARYFSNFEGGDRLSRLADWMEEHMMDPTISIDAFHQNWESIYGDYVGKVRNPKYGPQWVQALAWTLQLALRDIYTIWLRARTNELPETAGRDRVALAQNRILKRWQRVLSWRRTSLTQPKK